MKSDLYLTNGIIATDSVVFRGGVVVQDGKVLRLVEGDEQIDAQEVRDLGGRLVLPGLVDDHVHFNSPGRDEWEGAKYGSFAAAAGGVTTALEMPFNANPPTRNAELLRQKRLVVEAQTVIDMGLWGLLEDSNLDELEAMHNEGAVGFKAFLCDPGGMFGWPRPDDLRQALQITRRLGSLVGVHAESEELSQEFTLQMQASGRVDRPVWCESRPPAVELEAVQKALEAAEEVGGNLHVVHTTLPQGFAAIQQAKSRGASVTGETCPHYLSLSIDDLERIGPAAKCGPPLRSRETVEALWQDVLAGRVDMIGSDHCPCTPEMKEAGRENIWKAWGGISGIQAMLPVLLTEGVHRRGLPLTVLVRMTSLNPARRFGIYPQKGHLGAGADADLVVVDLNREWTYTPEHLLSRHKGISPYEGFVFKGAVESTYLRGVRVYGEGEIWVEPGYGRVVRR